MKRKLTVFISTLLLLGCNDPNGEISQCSLTNNNQIKDISYLLNPSGNAPLTASLSFVTESESAYTVTINGKNPISIKSDSCNYSHEVNLLGLYPNTDNAITISVNSGEVEKAVTIKTEPLPSYMPTIKVDIKSKDIDDLTLVNYRPSGAPFIVDRDGDIRWYLNIKEGKYGLILLDNGNLAYGSASGNKIVEYSWLGELLNTWDLGSDYSGVHHDVVEKPNGNFLVTVNKVGIATVEDHIIEIARDSGEIINVWDMRPLLPNDRTNLIADSIDWFHNNGIEYDVASDSLLLSGQRQGLVKVSRDNELKWILSQTDGYKGSNLPEYSTPDFEGWDGYEQYLLNSDNSDFEFIWGQHAPLVRDNGNVMLFDNGYNRYYDGVATETFSRVVEFKITENINKIGGDIELIWEYGESRGPDFQSRIISDVDDLGDSILMTTGALAFGNGWDINKIDKAKIVEIDYQTKTIKNEMTIISKIDASGSVYRAERLKFNDIGLSTKE